MGRALREIARRRAELVSRAEYERRAVARNRLWVSGPVVIAGRLLDLGRVIGVRPSVLHFAGGVLLAVWPGAMLRLAGRGLRFWMVVNRIKLRIGM